MEECKKLYESLGDDVQEFLLKKRYIEGYLECLADVRARLRTIIKDSTLSKMENVAEVQK